MGERDLTKIGRCACESGGDPGCLRCLRKKLQATGAVVFFREGAEWRLGEYQGDRPSDAAEVDWFVLLRSGAPEAIALRNDGVLLIGDTALSDFFGSAATIVAGSTVIGAPVKYGASQGVRLAWRDSSNPFSEADLRTMLCAGSCPPGCEPH